MGTEAGPVRRLRRAERRKQILDDATRVFARSGFVTTSLDEVAAEAGITRVTPYLLDEALDLDLAPKVMVYPLLARGLDRLWRGDLEGAGRPDLDPGTVEGIARPAG